MGHWGVKSYENDEASDALDVGFDRVHGDRYDALMDDRNPMTFEQVQQELADSRTLAASIEAIREATGPEVATDDWDDESRLAMVGVIVRYAELKVPIPVEWRDRAIAWLEGESIDWQEATARRMRREKEIQRLRRALTDEAAGSAEV